LISKKIQFDQSTELSSYNRKYIHHHGLSSLSTLDQNIVYASPGQEKKAEKWRYKDWETNKTR